MANVSYKHLWKRFGDVIALQDLNIEIEDKEFLVLVGPSGCGKTTALRCLAGLEEASEGEVSIGGEVVNDIPPKDRDIAMVFQSYALYPHMSVYDNMAFGLKLRRTPKAEIKERVDAAAKILGIEMLLERKPRELSGGQRQRVAVGRAIVREPKVFLFDEPLSNLDAKLRVQMRTEISRLHQRLATTFIYVTHDQVEAMTMATRIAVLNFGVLQQLDTPQELYDRPNNKFVAGFIGSPAMNFFDARLDTVDGTLSIIADDFTIPVPADKLDLYGKHKGSEVVFGIRPEDVHDPSYVPSGIHTAPVKAKVDVLEMMGNEIFLYWVYGDAEHVARIDPRSTFSVGEDIELMFNLDKIHLFDKSVDAENPPAIR
jgi:multiple sugar transport system ATP-binding protein